MKPRLVAALWALGELRNGLAAALGVRCEDPRALCIEDLDTARDAWAWSCAVLLGGQTGAPIGRFREALWREFPGVIE